MNIDAGQIVAAAAAVVSTGTTIVYTTRRWLMQARPAAVPMQRTVEQRLEAISELTRESSQEMEVLSAEIEARKATAESLQAEAEEAERLAQLNQEARDAELPAPRSAYERRVGVQGP